MPSNTYALSQLPCTPPNVPIDPSADLSSVASLFKAAFTSLTQDHIVPDAIWRDSFALTGSLRTFYSAESVLEAWNATSKIHHPADFEISGTPTVFKAPWGQWVDIAFKFLTKGVPEMECTGVLSVTPGENGLWRIWVMRTVLDRLVGEPSVDILDPVASDEDAQGYSTADDTQHFDCVVVGGGQAGLSVGGCLKSQGVIYVILDKHPEVGDSWKIRYDSTRLHTIREYAHLPFDRTFPDSYQEYLTKDDLVAGYRQWSKKYGINIWHSTLLVSGSWNSDQALWTLKTTRNGCEQTITCSNVVFATGAGSQIPYSPTYNNEGIFKGAIVHSAHYMNAAKWAGKHGVVIGSANTGHDLCEDMLDAGLASVTMVQRSKTYVVPVPYTQAALSSIYNSQIPTPMADRLYMSGPLVLGRLLTMRGLHFAASQDSMRFDTLVRAGFLLDRHGDLFYQLFQRRGGHYMDMGASKKISDGLIKMKSDSTPVSWAEDGLICADGSHLPADVVVFATGFEGDARPEVAQVFGDKIAAQAGELWGLDEEGEIKGAFKPTGHPAFWYHCGTIGHARYYARFIALQIKGRALGTPLPVYNGTRPGSVIHGT